MPPGKRRLILIGTYSKFLMRIVHFLTYCGKKALVVGLDPHCTLWNEVSFSESAFEGASSKKWSSLDTGSNCKEE